LLDAVKSGKPEFSQVILITNDNKSDWWEVGLDGKTVGPRVEIRQEIAKAGAKGFHMYTLVQFLEHLKTTTGPGAFKLSPSAFDEIKRTEHDAQSLLTQAKSVLAGYRDTVDTLSSTFDYENLIERTALRIKATQVCVKRFLRERYEKAFVSDSDDRADVVVQASGGLLGGSIFAGYVVRSCDSFDALAETILAGAATILMWRDKRSTLAHVPKVGVFVALFDVALIDAEDEVLGVNTLDPIAIQLADQKVELYIGRLDSGRFAPFDW